MPGSPPSHARLAHRRHRSPDAATTSLTKWRPHCGLDFIDSRQSCLCILLRNLCPELNGLLQISSPSHPLLSSSHVLFHLYIENKIIAQEFGTYFQRNWIPVTLMVSPDTLTCCHSGTARTPILHSHSWVLVSLTPSPVAPPKPFLAIQSYIYLAFDCGEIKYNYTTKIAE